MRIAHIVLPDATAYDRKSQRIDERSLSERHEILPNLDGADIAHIYGLNLSAAMFRKFPIPYVASAEPHLGPFSFRRSRAPRYLLSPLAPLDPEARLQNLPEAVADEYFVPIDAPQTPRDVRVVGVFDARRPGVRNMLEQTLARIQRFRSDVTWRIFDGIPSPEDLAGVDAWIDPTTSENDFDGFVAEAIAAGKVVIASRTAINAQRLEKGRTGLLVPCHDSNEMTHAILAALFKLEVARMKTEAAKQTAGKFRPRQRLRVLERIYEALVS
jgi:hypothetical protein